MRLWRTRFGGFQYSRRWQLLSGGWLAGADLHAHHVYSRGWQLSLGGWLAGADLHAHLVYSRGWQLSLGGWLAGADLHAHQVHRSLTSFIPDVSNLLSLLMSKTSQDLLSQLMDDAHDVEMMRRALWQAWTVSTVSMTSRSWGGWTIQAAPARWREQGRLSYALSCLLW